MIFDCDGTLVDSQNIIAESMSAAFAAEGLAWPGREATLSIVGLSLAEAFARLVPHLSPEARGALADRYREAFFRLRQDPVHHEPAFDGALEAIAALGRREDLVLGIATGKSRRGVDAVLERFGLNGRFSTIQTADDAPSKPHPGMVLQAMAEAGAEPERTIVVGDTVFDVEMARAARARAIGVSWGYHRPEALTAAGADRIAFHFRDLAGHLDALWESDP
ncbi:MAG: HAD-IA family hydrolase [Parvibaculaceae bacterium]